jgi:DNA-binding transcriptional LysR family regulator
MAMLWHAGHVNDIDLRQLRYFVAVAEERTFTRAATRLAMTQPGALSRAIRALEHSVGTALFVRLHRGVQMTAAGRVELAGETISTWPGTTAAEIAHWSGTDLTRHDWLPGPAIQDVAQLIGNVRLGQTIAFASLSLLGGPLPDGVAAVPTNGLSDSELHVAWAAATTSADVARFVQHAALTHLPPCRA